MSGVFCIGIAVLDFVYGLETLPTRAEKHRARDLAVVGGGLAANAAVAVARLGGQAWMATRLGDDLTGDAIVAGLAEEGVDTACCRRFPGLRSPSAAVLVDGSGERMVVGYADPGMPVDPGWLPTRLPAGTRAVLGDTRWPEGAAAIFGLARQSGLPAVLDADRAPPSRALVEQASHIAFSLQGLRELSGRDDPRDGLAAVASTTPAWLAVTLGADGVLFQADGGIAHSPAFPVKAVDTLGAGDVWHGAFALALAQSRREGEAVRFASATAAIKCTRFGGRRGTPSRAEVETFLQEHADG
jgi:sulfofructose kinase